MTKAAGLTKRRDELCLSIESALNASDDLSALLAHEEEDLMKEAQMLGGQGRILMQKLREACDFIETRIPAEDYKLPSYHELLFLVC